MNNEIALTVISERTAFCENERGHSLSPEFRYMWGERISELAMVRAEIERRTREASPPVPELDTDAADEIVAVLEQCDRIIDAAEDVPDRCTDFALSVIEKVASIKEWAEKRGSVTEKQQQALDNMEEGIERVRN